MVAFIILCICVNALTSYPIQILAAFTILERFASIQDENLDHHNGMHKVKKFTLRSIIIVMTTVVCMVVKTFTDFLNIAGALGSVTVAFILPQLFYVKTFNHEMSRNMKIGSFLIAFFGVIGSGYSIFFSIQKLSKGDLS